MAAETWRTKSGIIMFHLEMLSHGKPLVAIRRATKTFLQQVETIGTATTVDLSTRSGGEDVLRWTGIFDPVRMYQYLEAYPDTTRVWINCDLRCQDDGRREFVIPGGLYFWVQLMEVNSPPEKPLELNITLDTDIYIPKSWGRKRDNRTLAACNAPRFNQFLAVFLEQTGATVESVSADDYYGQVDVTGIVLHDPCD